MKQELETAFKAFIKRYERQVKKVYKKGAVVDSHSETIISGLDRCVCAMDSLIQAL